ncbi:hypothetical protein VNI00_014074 [Paramarasmius palmivorus]|uniref:Heterokaryon incompatibility domain-containing protein n=1 Tax=Paramarasmius palmivorus TaxID=297713 RepID=A0AAW0BWI0_9AGAR
MQKTPRLPASRESRSGAQAFHRRRDSLRLNHGSGVTIAYSAPLDGLCDTTIDFTPYFNPKRYRFIDADAFIHDRQLTIYEMASRPTHIRKWMTYTVISYVWYGLSADPSQLTKDGSFCVFCGVYPDGTPRENGGPISLKILEYVCKWACESASFYVWLDRLCILQTDKEDKTWQIARMYDIYQFSEQCIVLPGGLQRLASTTEETSWVDRAWTYQEALVTWDYAVVFTKDEYDLGRGQWRWLVEGECHWHFLVDLFVDVKSFLKKEERPCLILGTNEAALEVLSTIIEYKTLNEVAPSDGERIDLQAIDQLVIQGIAVRTFSRPVDMVFSILGLVGAQDILDHEHVQELTGTERFCATLALVEAVFLGDDDDDDDEDVPEASTGRNMLLDIPLWQSLEMLDTRASDDFGSCTSPILPTLEDLARLLDHDATEVQLIEYPEVLIKRAALHEWRFTYDPGVDLAGNRASIIAQEMQDRNLFRAFTSKEYQERVVVKHPEEGVIELSTSLQHFRDRYSMAENVVFGWTLKLEAHPFIRFFKFDISHLDLSDTQG